MALRAGLPVIILSLSVFIPSSARSDNPETPYADQLVDRSLKVRLHAAILLGNQRIVVAAPALRKVLATEEEHVAVRAAAAASLGRLGDEKSRSQLAALLGHQNKLLARAAEKALVLLDRKCGDPDYLVTVARPGLPPGDSPLHAERMLNLLRQELERAGGFVLGSGEDQVLHGDQLQAHLYRRNLRGIQLEPDLVDLTSKVGLGATRAFGTTRIRVLSLVDKSTEFVGTGEADAWVADTDISDQERIMLESQVLEESTDAALTEVLEYLTAP